MHFKHRGVEAERAGSTASLAVAWERQREALVIWLSGTLDRGTRSELNTELDARATDPTSLVVDLTGLEVIDASGLDTLARIHRRTTERGDRLCFRLGQHVAQRPQGLIRAAQLDSEWAPRHATKTPILRSQWRARKLVTPDPGDRPGQPERAPAGSERGRRSPPRRPRRATKICVPI
jgi:anti-anti-sigma factor